MDLLDVTKYRHQALEELGSLLEQGPMEIGELAYFVEMFEARHRLDFWIEREKRPLREICERLTYYAIYDR